MIYAALNKMIVMSYSSREMMRSVKLRHCLHVRLTYSDVDVTVKDMPNFAHSLERNQAFFDQCPDHIIFRDKKRQVHPNREGQWTTVR